MSSGTTWGATGRLMLVLGVALAVASLCGMLAGNARAGVPQATASLAAATVAPAPTVTLQCAQSATTGERLRLTGKVRHARARARTVVIYEKTSKGWVRVASARLTAEHRFAVRVSFPKAGAHQLRARYRAGGHTARSVIRVIHVRAADPLLGSSNTFFGSLLGKIVGGLVDGASGKIGGDAMGQVLSLLGWGDDSTQTAAALAAMDAKLDQIQQSLTMIENDLGILEVQLKITEEEILANVNDPHDAISDIDTALDEMNGIVSQSGGTPGAGDKENIRYVATQITNGFRIENDVNVIHDAMIPTDSKRSPVLDNLTDLAIQRVSTGASINDAYLGLERYFTELVYYQMRGVDLVVEAKQALTADGQPVGTTAATYLQSFRKDKLASEVENFKYNVWRLLLSKADLDHTATFLPPEAESIVSRAAFLSIQILGEDHFGLRTQVVITDDCAGGDDRVYSASGSGKTYLSQATSTSNVTGPTYDWWSGNVVTPSSRYTILDVDFGDVPAGAYTIKDGAGAVVTTMAVQKYDTDYCSPPSSTALPSDIVDYGYGVGSTRTGAVEAFAQNAMAGAWNHPGFHDVALYGTIDSGYVKAQGRTWNTCVSFAGEREADYTFVVGGTRPVEVKIPVNAHCIGSADCEFGGNHVTLYYSVGVWDGTASQDVGWQTGGQTTKMGTIGIDTTITRPFSFSAQPGHQYSVCYIASVECQSGDPASGSMEVHCGDGLEVEFP